MMPLSKRKQVADELRDEFGTNFTTDCTQLIGSVTQMVKARNRLLAYFGLASQSLAKETKHEKEFIQTEDQDYGQSSAVLRRKVGASYGYDKSNQMMETEMERDDGYRNKSHANREQIDSYVTESRLLHSNLAQISSSKDVYLDRAQTNSSTTSDVVIDKMVFKYMKNVNKFDIHKIEKDHDVKIKISTSKSVERGMILLEFKTRKKGVDISRARAEFDELQSKVMKTTKKVAISFKGVEKSKHEKVQEKIHKRFCDLVISWEEDNDTCILFGDVSVVKTVAEELNESIAVYESLVVDVITFEYLSVVHSDELKNIKETNGVLINLQSGASVIESQQIIYIKPNRSWRKKCKLDDVKKAKNEFIDLYQKVFFTLKRTTVKCTNIPEDIFSKAVHNVSQRHKVTVSRPCFEEIIICTVDTIAEQVVKEFRTLAGLITTRKLKKSSSDRLDINPQQLQSNTQDVTVTNEKDDGTFVTPEGIQIKIITADITKQRVDVIVNSSTQNMKHLAGISKAIADAAGPELQKECDDILRGSTIRVGGCRDTRAFSLPCKRLVHTVGPRHDDNRFCELLQKTFLNALTMSDTKLCAQSVAIPLIGSGGQGGSAVECTKALVTALEDFSRYHNHNLRLVIIVNKDEDISRVISDCCSQRFINQNSRQQTLDTKTMRVYKTRKGIEVKIQMGDVTILPVDLIVNAANKYLRHGGGVAGAISKAAGHEMQKDCRRLMQDRPPLQIGECVVTNGYKLPCRNILHTVGPIYIERKSDEEFYEELKHTFISVLQHASNVVKAKTIAIPLISSGIYAGPKRMCAQAALSAIEEFDAEEYQTIRTICLINLDDPSSKALMEAYSDKYSSTINPTKTVANTSVTTRRGNVLELVFKVDDITKQNVDIIVNPTDASLRNTMGVARAIAKAAGTVFQNHCQFVMKERRHAALQTGEVIKTRGFLLKCKYILHVQSPFYGNGVNYKQKYQEEVSKTYIECFSVASSIPGVRSIAVPVIGAGQGGCPKDVCAQALVTSVKEFQDREANLNLRLLVVVSIDKDVIDIVTRMAQSVGVVIRDSLTLNSNSSYQVTQDGMNKTYTQENQSPYFSSSNTSDSTGEEQASSRGNSTQYESKYKHTPPLKDSMSNINTQDDTFSSGENSRRDNAEDDYTQKMHVKNEGISVDYPNPGVSTFVDPTSMTREISTRTYASVTSRKPTNIVKPNNVSPAQCDNCYTKNDLKLLEGCNHIFCVNCITRCVAPASKCLKGGCGALYCIVEGKTPVPGTMTYFINSELVLPNTRGNGAIVIKYNFPDGTLPFNATKHRGRQYKGNIFTAYLPNCQQGTTLVWLLRTAFIAGFTFDVALDDAANVEVKWSGRIAHKTNIKGGFGCHGYPDRDYIEKVTKQLEKCNIRASLSSTDVKK